MPIDSMIFVGILQIILLLATLFVIILCLAIPLLIFIFFIKVNTETRIIDIQDVDIVIGMNKARILSGGSAKIDDRGMTLNLYNKELVQIPKKDLIGIVKRIKVG